MLSPLNNIDNGRKVLVTAYTASGLEGAALIEVLPQILEAPVLKKVPAFRLLKNGSVQLLYDLNSSHTDASDVKWYRCRKADGSDAIEVAVSRQGEPLKTYTLSAADIGYRLMAVIAPKTVRSKKGQPSKIIMTNLITAKEVKASPLTLVTDFRNQSLRNQPLIIPGFFTFSNAWVNEPGSRNTADTAKDAWYYGQGMEGAGNMTGLLQGRHARMLYTPVADQFSDMEFSLNISPFKTAGQGFSVAHLYMDILIKFDGSTMSGYALRFIRTTKYGNAVDCMLMKYTDGKATAITEAVTTSAYRTPCTIVVKVKGDELSARVSSASAAAMQSGEIQKEFKIVTRINPGSAGGFGIEYHGGSAAMINKIAVEWK